MSFSFKLHFLKHLFSNCNNTRESFFKVQTSIESLGSAVSYLGTKFVFLDTKSALLACVIIYFFRLTSCKHWCTLCYLSEILFLLLSFLVFPEFWFFCFLIFRNLLLSICFNFRNLTFKILFSEESINYQSSDNHSR